MKIVIVYFIIHLLNLMGFGNNDKKQCEPQSHNVYRHEVTLAFLNQVPKKYGLIYTGSGGSMPNDIESISLNFLAYRRGTIDEARELQVMLIEKFAQIINAHEKIRPFLREYPFPPSRINVRISFENPKKRKKRAAVANDEVTYVLQARNKIFYERDNPDNKYLFINVKEESYEEALEIVSKMFQEIDQTAKQLAALT